MIRSRRRKPPTQSLGRMHDDSTMLVNGGKRRRRRKKRRTAQHALAHFLCFVSFCFACWVGFIVIPSFFNGNSVTGKFLRSLNNIQSPNKLEYQALYDELFLGLRDNVSSQWDQHENGVSSHVPVYQHRPYSLSSTYGDHVLEGKCNLTVLLMDPRLPTMGSATPVWYTLESVAAFAPYACVLLQTASCKVRGSDEGVTDESERSVMESIFDHALPLFRHLIEMGQVRVTFLNHTKYNLPSCSDFSNPSAAWMNVNYWTDEFLDSDSDLVLTIQDDAVLCRYLDIDTYKNFCQVGAVWPRESNSLMPHPPEGMCRGMPNRWKSWLLPQRRWERQRTKLSVEKQYPRPNFLLNTSFPEICSNGQAPIGNGGLSLRNRTWLIRAIHACPHTTYSGIELDDKMVPCKVFDVVNEDFYFGVVLRGLRAPFPSAYLASLFSVEMLWPDESICMYGGIALKHVEPTVTVEGKSFAMPVGFHKPWWYQPNSLLESVEIQQACPFFKYIFDPQKSRWREFVQEKHWNGVGV